MLLLPLLQRLAVETVAVGIAPARHLAHILCPLLSIVHGPLHTTGESSYNKLKHQTRVISLDHNAYNVLSFYRIYTGDVGFHAFSHMDYAVLSREIIVVCFFMFFSHIVMFSSGYLYGVCL